MKEEEERPSKRHKTDSSKRRPPATPERESGKQKIVIKGLLSSRERDDFERKLHFLSLERDAILDATIFAMEHAEHFEEVVDLIASGLLHPTLIPIAKIAHLYLISDILHNSALTIQYVWRYRSA